MKNCGSLIHEEIATKAFMEEMREMVKQTNDKQIKEKLLEMIQNWGMAFRNSTKYRIVTVKQEKSSPFWTLSDFGFIFRTL